MQRIDDRLEEAGLPYALHQDKHGREEDKREPINVFDDPEPFRAEKYNRQSRRKRNVGQFEIKTYTKKRYDYLSHYQNDQCDQRDFAQISQPGVFYQ